MSTENNGRSSPDFGFWEALTSPSEHNALRRLVDALRRLPPRIVIALATLAALTVQGRVVTQHPDGLVGGLVVSGLMGGFGTLVYLAERYFDARSESSAESSGK